MSDPAPRDGSRRPPRAGIAPLAPRGLRLWLVTAALARTADEMCPTGFFLVVLTGTGRVWAASLVVGCLTAAAGLAGPSVGSRLDRSASPRLVTAAAMAVIAAALLGTVLLTLSPAWAGTPSLLAVAAVLVLAAGAGTAAPAVSGGWTAQLGALAPAAELPRATALDATTYNVAGIAGPGLVGLLSAVASAQAAVLTSALLMATALVAALRMPDPVTRGSTVDGSVRRRTSWAGWSGLEGLLATSPMRWVTVVTTVGYLGMGVAFVAAGVRGAELWQASAGGLLLAAFAGGALLGTATMSLARFHSVGEVAVTAGTAGLGACLLGAGSMPHVGGAAAVLVLGGWCEGLLFTGLLRVRHRESPDGSRGVVFTTAASLKLAAYAVGVVTAGALPPSGPLLFAVAGSLQLVALASGALALELGRP